MAAQTQLTTKNAAAVVINPEAEGAQKGYAEWRERNATYGSKADTVYTLEMSDKGDDSPFRSKMITEMKALDANGVVIGKGTVMVSLIAYSGAGEPFLQGLFNRARYALDDAQIEQAFTDRKKIT